jgi:hypothetical protein
MKIAMLILIGITFRRYYLFITLLALSIYVYTNYLKTKGKKLKPLNFYAAIFIGLAIVFAIPNYALDALNLDFIAELRDSRVNLNSGALLEARSTIDVGPFSNDPLSNFFQLLWATSHFLFPFYILDLNLYGVATFIIILICVYPLVIGSFFTGTTSDLRIHFLQIFLFSFFVCAIIFEPDL